jgi:hypothetical protein
MSQQVGHLQQDGRKLTRGCLAAAQRRQRVVITLRHLRRSRHKVNQATAETTPPSPSSGSGSPKAQLQAAGDWHVWSSPHDLRSRYIYTLCAQLLDMPCSHEHVHAKGRGACRMLAASGT